MLDISPHIQNKFSFKCLQKYASFSHEVYKGLEVHAFYSFAAPSHVLHIRRSNGPNRNRTQTVLTQISSHNQPRNHDLAYTLTTKPLAILKRHTPPWAMMGPCYLFLGYYSVHPRKRRVVLSQLPHILWT